MAESNPPLLPQKGRVVVNNAGAAVERVLRVYAGANKQLLPHPPPFCHRP